jgi:thymidylate synthase ThyX
VRGLLPAATVANVGVYATGQAYEAMLIRLRAHPLAEARACGDLVLRELRKVIPEFLTRVDRHDRGEATGAYVRESGDRARAIAARLGLGAAPAGPDGPCVRLVEFDPDGESRVLAHALWAESGGTLPEVRERVAGLTPAERGRAIGEIVGRRGDRRQRPGRALEATSYAFEVVTDYGAYRDLQRHRLLSLQAQPLTPALGYDLPEILAEAGLDRRFAAAQARSAALHDAIAERVPEEACYAVTLAHRIRFTMVMNAREAMHLIELRSQPQGHDAYRAVALEMHRLIREQAGHEAIADAMAFVDRSAPEAGRMEAERRSELRALGARSGDGRSLESG